MANRDSNKTPWDDFKPVGGRNDLKESPGAGMLVKLLVVAASAALFAGFGWWQGGSSASGRRAPYEARRDLATANKIAERRARIGLLLGAGIGSLVGAGLAFGGYRWRDSPEFEGGRLR
ncbi:MAG: hypothetical protein SF028_09895 [Candidatus Sumerlaeia bacterium]|nr:hypothetical protein [Candidatus Sumerlaeia bacterium]